MSRSKSKPTTPPATTNADPIFAAIATHQAAASFRLARALQNFELMP